MTPAAPVPSTPSPETLTLRDYRAQKKEPPVPVADPTPAAPPTVATTPEPAHPLSAPPEPPDDPEPATVKPPEQGPDHRWRDPETGIRLDMRRRDHRQMKRALEDRAALAHRLAALEQRVTQQAPPAPESARPQVPPAPAAHDPSDPEPTLEQFADQPDPYSAYTRAVARWEARQAHREFEAQRTRVESARQTAAQIDSAQSAWDAKLPDVKQRYPDFDAAYHELHDTLRRIGRGSRPLVQYLLTAEHGHDVAYFLGNHPQEVEALFRAPSLDAHLRAIGALEARVVALAKRPAAPPAPPMTPPPAPMTPVGASGTPTSFNPQTASLAQYRALKKGLRRAG